MPSFEGLERLIKVVYEEAKSKWKIISAQKGIFVRV